MNSYERLADPSPEPEPAGGLKLVETAEATHGVMGPPYRWADMELELSDQNIFGKSTLPTNPMARVRNIFNAAIKATDDYRAAHPEQYPETVIQKEGDIAGNIGEIDKLLKGTRKTGGQEYVVGEAIPFQQVSQELWGRLERENNPLWQAMQQVRLRNALRTVDVAHGDDQPTLSQRDIERLGDDLLKYAFKQEIKDYYEIHINDIRRRIRSQN